VLLNIEELEENEKIFKINKKRQFIRDLVKPINLVGGVAIWDALQEKEAYDKAWQYVEGHIIYISIFNFNGGRIMENKEMVQLLVEAGADPNFENEEEVSAITYAEDFGYTELVELMKEGKNN
jgi:hypothetical protein